nr:unnamed protein product [Spirometra erinaceieuropaei]
MQMGHSAASQLCPNPPSSHGSGPVPEREERLSEVEKGDCFAQQSAHIPHNDALLNHHAFQVQLVPSVSCHNLDYVILPMRRGKSYLPLSPDDWHILKLQVRSIQSSELFHGLSLYFTRHERNTVTCPQKVPWFIVLLNTLFLLIGLSAEISAKENVTPVAFDARSSLSYMKRTTYTFDRSLSVGDPSTAEVISLSLSSLALLEATRTGRGPSPELIQFLTLLLNLSPFAKMSFSDHVWGNSDDLLSLCHAFTPETCKTDKLGLLLNVNNSLVGPYIVDSGRDNNSYIGQILSFKNQSSFDIWSSAEANFIQGTDGTRFAPDIHLNNTYNIFVPTLCRSLLMEAFRETRPSTFRHLRVLEMRPHQSNYEAAETNLRNAGFCALEPSGPQCPPQGLFDIASCKAPGAIKPPLFASLPHFLHADQRLQSALDGVRPANPRYDGIRLLVEPKSGLVVEAHSRLQINAFFAKSRSLGKLSGDLKDPIFLPIAWFDAVTVADGKVLSVLHEQLYETPTRILRILICTCVFSFVACLAMAATLRSSSLCICCPFRRSPPGTSSGVASSTFYNKIKPGHSGGMRETTSSRQLLEAQDDPQADSASVDTCDQNTPSPWGGGHFLTCPQSTPA